jgi:preprotein translocase subunit Sec63
LALKAFLRGERVVLAEGTYQGILGVFLHLRTDNRWADIEEANGVIRSHQMQWLPRATGSGLPTTREVSNEKGALCSS